MGKLKSIFRKLTFVVALMCAVFIVGHTASQKVAVEYHISENMGLLPFYSDIINYEEVSSNVYKCDIATVSNIVLGMEGDGFLIGEWIEASDKCLDFTLCKDGVTYRLYYTEGRVLTSICSDYEKSYIPLTYVNGKENREGDEYGG